MKAMRLVDPEGVINRTQHKLRRRQYFRKFSKVGSAARMRSRAYHTHLISTPCKMAAWLKIDQAMACLTRFLRPCFV